jgi:SAM-dependent methyltransferase
MTRHEFSRGLTFDEVAGQYDLFRPRYPSALFDDLRAVVGIGPDSRILEVGCGPGVATEEMMSRGWSVLAVDPGAQLAEVAHSKFGDDRFTVEVSTFDDWDPRGRHFDLVFSATAYHWVAPEVRWNKAAQVWNDGGYLALATNEVDDRGTFHDFTVATRDLRQGYGVGDEEGAMTMGRMRTLVKESGGDIGVLWEALSRQGTDVLAGEFFSAPDVRLYTWSATYSTSEALGLLATYSRFLVLEPSRRSTLLERLATVIDNDFAGRLTRHYVTVLAMAARA